MADTIAVIGSLLVILGIILIYIGSTIQGILNKKSNTTTAQKNASKGLITIGVILLVLSLTFWVDVFKWDKSLLLAVMSLVMGTAIIILGIVVEEDKTKIDVLTNIIITAGAVALAPGLVYMMTRQWGANFTIFFVFGLGIVLASLGGILLSSSKDDNTLKTHSAVVVGIGGFLASMAAGFIAFTRREDIAKWIPDKKKVPAAPKPLGGLFGKAGGVVDSQVKKATDEAQKAREDLEKMKGEKEKAEMDARNARQEAKEAKALEEKAENEAKKAKQEAKESPQQKQEREAAKEELHEAVGGIENKPKRGRPPLPKRRGAPNPDEIELPDLRRRDSGGDQMDEKHND